MIVTRRSEQSAYSNSQTRRVISSHSSRGNGWIDDLFLLGAESSRKSCNGPNPYRASDMMIITKNNKHHGGDNQAISWNNPGRIFLTVTATGLFLALSVILFKRTVATNEHLPSQELFHRSIRLNQLPERQFYLRWHDESQASSSSSLRSNKEGKNNNNSVSINETPKSFTTFSVSLFQSKNDDDDDDVEETTIKRTATRHKTKLNPSAPTSTGYSRRQASKPNNGATARQPRRQSTSSNIDPRLQRHFDKQ